MLCAHGQPNCGSHLSSRFHNNAPAMQALLAAESVGNSTKNGSSVVMVSARLGGSKTANTNAPSLRGAKLDKVRGCPA